MEDEFTTTGTDAEGVAMTFNIIEDESGDIYWSYGHDVTEGEFVSEVNRWLVYTGNEDSLVDSAHLERLWACPSEGSYERFCVHTGPNADTFPVTRVML